MKNVYCPECGHKGYEMDNGQPYCPNCGQLLYIDEIQKAKIEAKRNDERKRLGLVSYEDLLKLPRKYSLPRKYMSIVLNLDDFGDAFGVSVWDGEVPTIEESDRIRQALNDPEYYLERLKEVKAKIPKKEYEKSYKRASR